MADGRLEAAPARAEKRLAWRPWLRAIHRDLGYFGVGLTLVYALSGLAVNHIADWDPSFRQISSTQQLPAPLPADAEALGKAVLQSLGINEAPREVYAAGDDAVDIVFDQRTLHVTPSTGKVVEEGQSPRWFLRAANWLHLNRGKKAWTYVADTYAVILLYLAISGLFMLPGRKGLLGRGAAIALLGAAVPIGYVVLSGGPEAKNGSQPANGVAEPKAH
ncbi:MAG TPA: PepSY-associated TM helix domain-containing protein [Polyangiaceae bacterium]|nr:PepSY-associated TM helix domain-containing protein [Polyangiaceae bacterium]